MRWMERGFPVPPTLCPGVGSAERASGLCLTKRGHPRRRLASSDVPRVGRGRLSGDRKPEAAATTLSWATQAPGLGAERSMTGVTPVGQSPPVAPSPRPDALASGKAAGSQPHGESQDQLGGVECPRGQQERPHCSAGTWEGRPPGAIPSLPPQGPTQAPLAGPRVLCPCPASWLPGAPVSAAACVHLPGQLGHFCGSVAAAP